MSELWEGSCNHFETYLPVIHLHHLSAIHPVPVAAGPRHLPNRWVCLQNTPQCGRGMEALVNCMVMQEDLQNKTVPCLPNAKPVTIFPSLSYQSASPDHWPQLLLCSCAYVLTHSQPCSGQSLPNSRQPCILSNQEYAWNMCRHSYTNCHQPEDSCGITVCTSCHLGTHRRGKPELNQARLNLAWVCLHILNYSLWFSS